MTKLSLLCENAGLFVCIMIRITTIFAFKDAHNYHLSLELQENRGSHLLHKRTVADIVRTRVNQTANKNDTSSWNNTTNNFNYTRPASPSRVYNYEYYNSTSYTDPETFKHYWVNLSNFENVSTHEVVSSAHRRAATVTLSFEFPFYGHLIKNVTIATGGFLYTGDYVHSWLAATQYIAPLMANFDTSLSNDSFVRYIDNGTSFTVLWEKVALKDRPKDGDFTFQTTLHKNGDIIFAYENVPEIFEDIKDDMGHVRIGLSDAYIIDRIIFYIRRKTIYEYHRVNIQKQDIRNGTVIILRALPTCLEQTDCESCLTKKTSFLCTWCPKLKRCSTGLDHHRQAWLTHCGQNNIKDVAMCNREIGLDPLENENSALNSHLNVPKVFTQAPPIVSKNITKDDVKLKPPLSAPQVPYVFPTNVTRVGTERDVRLLGANGTGQRRMHFSTSEPTVISSTYPPLLHDIIKNDSGKLNTNDFDNNSISKKELNKTLAQHNINSEKITYNYEYYNSTSYTDPETFNHYWVNLSYFENVSTHEVVSSAHRRAANVTLSFEFPFYGNLIKNVTIATGGFLYTGDYVHSWLAATQYIAPLMANFDTSLSNDSFVRYIDNGSSFTVLWEKVALKDTPEDGDFTFQTTLHKNGDIIFAYENVPIIIEDIKDDMHPVKVGLSDAYIIDSIKIFIRRKTIYDHRVNVHKHDIRNGTVIIFKALPTCLHQTDCESCLTKKTSFLCTWCPKLKKCSTGLDRHSQAWLTHCEHKTIKDVTMCNREIGLDPLEEENSAFNSHLNVPKVFTQAPPIVSKNITKDDVKLKPPLSAPQVPYVFPTNVTRVGTERDVRLLGANGTGQRRMHFSTSEPTVISSTYPPLLHDIIENDSGKLNTNDFDDNFSISKFKNKELNKTLAQHNITSETITYNYEYYNSTSYTDPETFNHYWVNLSYFENVSTHEVVSSAHRRAATVTLSFEFPFYGNLIKNVTIATGGFLYTGDYVHSWLAATQYIAPLMANFDTSLSNDSFVRYIDNGTSFTVLWEKVVLKDTPKDGDFTFQTTLHKNGDIIFAYEHVPEIIEDINDDMHPVKVGLSDAYIIDSKKFFIGRKTIYEYHRVNVQKQDIRNGTVIILKALPTCLEQTDCESCLTKKTSFLCTWCPNLKRCSSGLDRHRQAWLTHCGQNNIKDVAMCNREIGLDHLDDENFQFSFDFPRNKSTIYLKGFDRLWRPSHFMKFFLNIFSALLGLITK
ncbi:hypothetical protein WA026_000815 [Henosepilachna vigintioctopunctata]|uniref:PSI domain-containing protein n=1 Tax=Henosepilachna vigintioctopunctata TaxID=420089 RepID=A0AAW1UZQ2_9CUCU